MLMNDEFPFLSLTLGEKGTQEELAFEGATDSGLRTPAPSHLCGVSMIEALVAILILSFALLGLAFLQAQGMKSNTGAYARTQATILAYDILDRIRANPANPASYESKSSGATGACATAVSTNAPSGTCSAATASAGNDLICWYASLAATLAGAGGCIDYDSTLTDRIAVSVTINWTNQKTRKLAGDTSSDTVPQSLTISTEIPLPI